MHLVSSLATEHNCHMIATEIIHEVAQYNEIQWKDNTFWTNGPRNNKRIRNDKESRGVVVAICLLTQYLLYSRVTTVIQKHSP